MSNEENMLRVQKRNPYQRFKHIYNERFFDESLDDLEYTILEEIQLKECSAFSNLSHSVGHVPMKKESKKLRQLMSKTGLSSSEIYNIKKYKQELANINLEKPSSIRQIELIFIKTCKIAMSNLQLPIWNPMVIEEIRRIGFSSKDISYAHNLFYQFLLRKDLSSEYIRLIKIKKEKK